VFRESNLKRKFEVLPASSSSTTKQNNKQNVLS